MENQPLTRLKKKCLTRPIDEKSRPSPKNRGGSRKPRNWRKAPQSESESEEDEELDELLLELEEEEELLFDSAEDFAFFAGDSISARIRFSNSDISPFFAALLSRILSLPRNPFPAVSSGTSSSMGFCLSLLFFN